MKIGVLGGTFDPVHNGHIMMAEKARDELGLDKVILVPAGKPMSKPGQKVSPAEDRIAMLEMAVKGKPKLEISNIEIERPGPSYTAETLTELRKCVGEEDELYFILGMDSLKQLKEWYRPERILEIARIAVVTRPGYTKPDTDEMKKTIPGITERTVFINGMKTDISATKIRKKAEKGEKLDGIVPGEVAEYIATHNLYTRGSR